MYYLQGTQARVRGPCVAGCFCSKAHPAKPVASLPYWPSAQRTSGSQGNGKGWVIIVGSYLATVAKLPLALLFHPRLT